MQPSTCRPAVRSRGTNVAGAAMDSHFHTTMSYRGRILCLFKNLLSPLSWNHSSWCFKMQAHLHSLGEGRINSSDSFKLEDQFWIDRLNRAMCGITRWPRDDKVSEWDNGQVIECYRWRVVSSPNQEFNCTTISTVSDSYDIFFAVFTHFLTYPLVAHCLSTALLLRAPTGKWHRNRRFSSDFQFKINETYRKYRKQCFGIIVNFAVIQYRRFVGSLNSYLLKVTDGYIYILFFINRMVVPKSTRSCYPQILVWNFRFNWLLPGSFRFTLFWLKSSLQTFKLPMKNSEQLRGNLPH